MRGEGGVRKKLSCCRRDASDSISKFTLIPSSAEGGREVEGLRGEMKEKMVEVKKGEEDIIQERFKK